MYRLSTLTAAVVAAIIAFSASAQAAVSTSCDATYSNKTINTPVQLTDAFGDTVYKFVALTLVEGTSNPKQYSVSGSASASGSLCSSYATYSGGTLTISDLSTPTGRYKVVLQYVTGSSSPMKFSLTSSTALSTTTSAVYKGTVYTDSTGTTAKSGATITITDSTGTITMTSASDGTFESSSGDPSGGFTAKIGSKSMSSKPTTGKCATCHGSSMPIYAGSDTSGGTTPTASHATTQAWVNSHRNTGKCTSCHGSDYKGTSASKTSQSRSFSTKWGTKTFSSGQTVGCYDCHSGPSGGSGSSDGGSEGSEGGGENDSDRVK